MTRPLLPLAALLALSALPVSAGSPAAPLSSPPLAGSWVQANAAPRPAAPEWWRGYGDPVLDRLVAQALTDSPDMAGALARIDQARANVRGAGAARLPSGQVQGSLAHAEQSIDNGLGRLSRYVPTLSRTQDVATLNASLGWDLDLAGGLRHGARAARADLVGAQAGLAATRLALAGEVVAQYLSLRAAQTQLALLTAQHADAAARLQHAAARLAWQDGSAREHDDRAADAAALAAALPPLRARIAGARFALAVLTGQTAQTALEGLDSAAVLPLGCDPAAGVPADLLRRRPDLALAEARLVGAHARVGAALGEYWPHVSLGGLFGFDTSTLGTFGAGSSRVAQGFLGLRWRLFDFARIDAEVAGARGAEREALAAYRGAVLKAGAQVETSFAVLAASRAALAAQEDRLAAVTRAYDHAVMAQRLGEISDDQLRQSSLARLAAAQDALAARLAAAQALLDCHKALGG